MVYDILHSTIDQVHSLIGLFADGAIITILSLPANVTIFFEELSLLLPLPVLPHRSNALWFPEDGFLKIPMGGVLSYDSLEDDNELAFEYVDADIELQEVVDVVPME